LNEVWRIDGGAPRGFIFYPRENVRLNAECRSAAGQFVCDGARFLRSGMPVEIARRALDGRTSAGVKVCMRMGQPLVTARNSVGSEDSFCQFPDGSLVSSGALEQYKMRVIQ
jgi:putative hemolysin